MKNCVQATTTTAVELSSVQEILFMLLWMKNIPVHHKKEKRCKNSRNKSHGT